MARAHVVKLAVALCLSADSLHGVAASHPPRPTTTPAPIVVRRVADSFTAITGCHPHGDEAFCFVGDEEYQIIVPATATGEVAPTYTGCHAHHNSKTFCFAADGSEIEVLVGAEEEGHDHEEADNDQEEGEAEESSGENCHFHAGVEHCNTGDHILSGEVQCSRRDRDYNIPLRIGLVFAMLATSFIGVALPIFLKPLLPGKLHIIFTLLKQFGTGVIIATALIHLFTHASLMFNNECLGNLEYEAVTAAIVLAGLFVAFLVEYTTHRVARKYWATSPHPDDVVSVTVLEAGIIFHSLLVGLTLVVAGDSVFITLFVVIVFHQAFEGIALGTRIAAAGRMVRDNENSVSSDSPRDSKEAPEISMVPASSVGSPNGGGVWKPLGMLKKLAMASAFAVVTPVGMAIGIGVLHQFNGNEPSTVIAIGTLDALSAGILIWVGVVEMWATDWMFGGELENAGAGTTLLAGFGLVAGFILMGLLGKWA